MDMQGQRALPVSQALTWDALNNPDVLKACIPGCDRFETDGSTLYNVGVTLKIGPVAAKFAGKVSLLDIVAPQSYALQFEGQGGVAGFGKGTAQVQLQPQGTGCELTYTVNAQVGGKIAQLESHPFQLRTEVATIGVRGTTFWGGVLDGTHQFALLNGNAIIVENKAGRVEITQAGEGTAVTSDSSAPVSPSAWAPDKMARAAAMTP